MPDRERERRRGALAGGVGGAGAAGCLVLLFLAGTFASAAGMHGCPQHHHHRPPPAALASTAVPDADASDAPAARDGAPERDPAGPTCTCLGDCQAGAPSALHRPPPHRVLQPESIARLRPPRDPRVRRGPRSDYFLPYPLGPPAA